MCSRHYTTHDCTASVTADWTIKKLCNNGSNRSKQKNLERKTCHSATVSTKNPTRTCLGSTQASAVTQVSNCCLSHDTVSVQLWGCVRFEVLTAVLLRIQAFWDVTQSHWVSGSWPFKRSSWPHLYRSRSSWRWKHHVPLKCQEPQNIHSSTSHTSCTLDYGAVYSLLSWLPPVHYTTNTTVFLTMHHHHHWTEFWCSLANGNQFRDPLRETFSTHCHSIISPTSVTWLQTHMPVWAVPISDCSDVDKLLVTRHSVIIAWPQVSAVSMM